MSLIDSIIGAESGGDPNAMNLKEVFRSTYVFTELRIVRIIKLLFVSGPPAIFRFVIPLRVDAINSVFGGWLRAHVRNKILKTSLPAVAYLNAFCSVVFVADVSRTRTPLFHSAPSSVFGRLFQTMRRHHFPHCFFMKTSTTLRPQGS